MPQASGYGMAEESAIMGVNALDRFRTRRAHQIGASEEIESLLPTVGDQIASPQANVDAAEIESAKAEKSEIDRRHEACQSVVVLAIVFTLVGASTSLLVSIYTLYVAAGSPIEVRTCVQFYVTFTRRHTQTLRTGRGTSTTCHRGERLISSKSRGLCPWSS